MKTKMTLRALVLFIIIVLAMTACTPVPAGTDETPKPEETVVPASTPAPAETPAAEDPTPEPVLTPVAGQDNPNIDYSKTAYENAEALIAEYGWTGEAANPERFQWATYSYPEDWNINPDMPLSLYKYAYNIDASNRYANARDLFRTNKEAMVEVPTEIIDAAIQEATGYNQTMFTFDYRDVKAWRKGAQDHYPPVGYINDFIDECVREGKAEEQIYYSAFITDPTLVYIDIDNAVRVRGMQMYYLDHNIKTEEELGMKKNVWLYSEIEFRVRTTQDVANACGIKVWRDAPYSIYDIVSLIEDWRVATADEIALMERTVGNPLNK